MLEKDTAKKDNDVPKKSKLQKQDYFFCDTDTHKTEICPCVVLKINKRKRVKRIDETVVQKNKKKSNKRVTIIHICQFH